MAAAPPDALDRDALKEIVWPIILTQGNVFIKELLRRYNIPIGATKADFAANLMAAIDDGRLTQPMIEEWLGEVEGWGNQHIYLVSPPVLTRDQIRAALLESPHAPLLDRPVSYDFPDALMLTSVALTRDHFSMAWHRSNAGWDRATSRDFQREEDADLYEYRAYRQRLDRSVVRFEWRFADPFAAILIQLPNEGTEHADALARVSEDLRSDGISEAAPVRLNLGTAFKALNRDRGTRVQLARLIAEGAHVDFVSTLADGGIGDVAAVRDVLQGADNEQFASADGIFHFRTEDYPRLSRAIKIQGYGLESRLRVWVQCKRDDVYEIIDLIWAHNA